MNTPSIQSTKRLDVVDALRGYALLAIVLLHCLEHYNLFCFPEFYPPWLKSLDKGVWDTIFFAFAGKAYATFSLLFGFSFFVQFRNEERRGVDFRLRFAWRMFLLFIFSQFHAFFYNGDILLLYAIVGLTLIPVCRLKDRTVLIIATVLLLQPIEWGRMIYGACHPGCETYGEYFRIFASKVKPLMRDGSFWELAKANIGYGQLYSNLWQVEHGRLFQTAALFMFGMLLGRRRYFEKNDTSIRFWKQTLRWSVVTFIPFNLMRTYLPDTITKPSVRIPFDVVIPSLDNFSFMCVLIFSRWWLSRHRQGPFEYLWKKGTWMGKSKT